MPMSVKRAPSFLVPELETQVLNLKRVRLRQGIGGAVVNPH
jgi:hypothetical protein